MIVNTSSSSENLSYLAGQGIEGVEVAQQDSTGEVLALMVFSGRLSSAASSHLLGLEM